MAAVPSTVREKRLQNPRKVYSPSVASVPSPSNYLIYLEDTASHLIVGRSSVKTIKGKKATLVLNNKKFLGEIVFAGTFSNCQMELNKIQHASQLLGKDETNEFNDEDEDGLCNYDYNQDDDYIGQNEEDDHDVVALNNQPGPSEDKILYDQDFGKKRKLPDSYSLNNAPRQAKRSKEGNSDESTAGPEPSNDDDVQLQTTTEKHLSSNGNSLKSIENKMAAMSKNMQKMGQAMREMAASNTKTGSQNLDCYRDSNTQEIFPPKVIYNGRNLLEIVGTDFGDFARQVMRDLYTEEELKTCILPPKRSHLVREPLDSVRFALLQEAVQVKYRLSSHMYDSFYKYHLGPKLGDFLVEERRRELNKEARKQAKLALALMRNEQPTID